MRIEVPALQWSCGCRQTTNYGRLTVVFLLTLVQNVHCVRYGKRSHHTDWGMHLPIKVLTVMSNHSDLKEAHTLFRESFDRARELENPMELQASNVSHQSFWDLGWKSKFVNILPVFRELPPEQIVMLADSTDIIWLPCGRDLRSAFLKFKVDIVLGCSEHQWPAEYKDPLFPDMQLLDPHIPFPDNGWAETVFYRCKYVNAGVVVGRARALAHYIGGTFLRYGWIESHEFDDQSFWTNMYLAQYHDIGSHDNSGHPTLAIDSGGLFAATGPNDYFRNETTGYWQNPRHRYTVCMIHAPGGKQNFGPLHEQYKEWSKQPQPHAFVKQKATKDQ